VIRAYVSHGVIFPLLSGALETYAISQGDDGPHINFLGDGLVSQDCADMKSTF
jgi:hypothetical protein